MVRRLMLSITTRTYPSLASSVHRLLTCYLGRGSKSPRKRSRIIVVRSTTANLRTTVSLQWPLSPTPTSSPTCSRIRNPRGLTSSWHLTPRTSSVDHVLSTPLYTPLTSSSKIWSNLNMSASQLAGKRTMGWVYLVLAAFFNTIPLFILSILANLSSVSNPYHPKPSSSSQGQLL